MHLVTDINLYQITNLYLLILLLSLFAWSQSLMCLCALVMFIYIFFRWWKHQWVDCVEWAREERWV